MAIYKPPLTPPPAEYSGQNVQSAQVTGEGQWTRPMTVAAGDVISVSLSGTFDATVVFQRMLDGVNWRAVPNADGTVGWTGPTEQVYDADEAAKIRIGVDTGNYVSGTAVCRLGRG